MKVLKTIGKLLGGLLAIAAAFWLFLVLTDEPVFGPEQDVELGRQSVQAIEEDPDQGPVLSRAEYPEAYANIDRIVGDLLRSSAIQYREIFRYQDVKIIQDDEVLNAFCTPGGFIYVYSGLIKYLDSEDHLAGVLGHEIAHAELRHSSVRLQKQYGADRLFAFILLATPMALREAWALSILGDLTSLTYSRGQEADADKWSVRYLSDTGYSCDGTAGFFEKLTGEGTDVKIPEFLNDHPDSAARIRDIQEEARALACSTNPASGTSWREFQESLP